MPMPAPGLPGCRLERLLPFISSTRSMVKDGTFDAWCSNAGA